MDYLTMNKKLFISPGGEIGAKERKILKKRDFWGRSKDNFEYRRRI